jgi:hypothetical protein
MCPSSSSVRSEENQHKSDTHTGTSVQRSPPYLTCKSTSREASLAKVQDNASCVMVEAYFNSASMAIPDIFLCCRTMVCRVSPRSNQDRRPRGVSGDAKDQNSLRHTCVVAQRNHSIFDHPEMTFQSLMIPGKQMIDEGELQQ